MWCNENDAVSELQFFRHFRRCDGKAGRPRFRHPQPNRIPAASTARTDKDPQPIPATTHTPTVREYDPGKNEVAGELLPAANPAGELEPSPTPRLCDNERERERERTLANRSPEIQVCARTREDVSRPDSGREPPSVACFRPGCSCFG